MFIKENKLDCYQRKALKSIGTSKICSIGRVVSKLRVVNLRRRGKPALGEIDSFIY